jgi:hypothetical protein
VPWGQRGGAASSRPCWPAPATAEERRGIYRWDICITALERMKCPLVLRGDAVAESGARWYIRSHKDDSPATTAHSVPFCSPSRPGPVCPRPWLLGSSLKNPDCGALDRGALRGRSEHRAYTAPRSLPGHPLPRRARWTVYLDDAECGRGEPAARRAPSTPKGLLSDPREAHTGWEREESRRNGSVAAGVQCGTCIRPTLVRLAAGRWRLVVGGPVLRHIVQSWRRAVAASPMNSCAKALNLSTWSSRRPGPIETARCSGSCCLLRLRVPSRLPRCRLRPPQPELFS